MAYARVLRLTVTNFRSYRAAQLICEPGMVVLAGPNGAGKTNLLEALSFLTPGRGLRRATLEAVAAQDGDGGWAVAAQIDGALGLATLGTGIEPQPPDNRATERKCRIDGEPVGSAAAFADHLAVIWLVPAMDGLFAGPASERRRFVDRLALAIDGAHGARVNALERSLRSRNRLLTDPSPDPHWLDAIEHETAELAIAVAAARAETVTRLNDAIAGREPDSTHFPTARLILAGAVEADLGRQSAGVTEDRYRAALRAGRGRDAAAGRTLEGPHLSDLTVLLAANGRPAAQASTGEQKALLIGLVLAHAELVARISRIAPLLLLDEVVAHLDPGRRRALYEQLDRLGAQVWMSGADPATFAELRGRAATFEVAPGRAVRQ